MKKLVLTFVLCVTACAAVFAQNNPLILANGGTFKMGKSSEKDAPVHTVTVSSFYMSQSKITIEEWMNNTGVYPSGYEENYYGRRVPQNLWKTTAVANVTWFDAIVYCNRRSSFEGLTPCYASNGSKDAVTNASSLHQEFPNVTCDWSANGYRLPTEAEWEYAARNEGRIKDFTKGNAEWCWDWYSSSYYNACKNAVDPHGPDYGDLVFSSGGQRGNETMCRVLRGGCDSINFASPRIIPIYERSKLSPREYESLVGPIPFTFRVVRNAR